MEIPSETFEASQEDMSDDNLNLSNIEESSTESKMNQHDDSMDMLTIMESRSETIQANIKTEFHHEISLDEDEEIVS